MNLNPGSWATEADKVAAAAIVERLSSGLREVAASYEEACKPFAAAQYDGEWSWFDSQIFRHHFLVTDVFEDLRNRQEFDAMAVPWRQVDQKSYPEIYTPPLIQVSKGACTPKDVFEHEATHVAQLLVDHQFPGRPRLPFPGPIPFLSERILKEFEAYLVQSVYFERAYESRVVLDFNCIESAQLAALRSGFMTLLRQWVSASVAHDQFNGSSSSLTFSISDIAGDLLRFGASLSDTFRGTVLDTADAIPTLDQLAMHLYVQIGKHVDLFSPNDPRRQHLLGTFVPVFLKWSDYESSNPFQILRRFRPPNLPPQLNEKVIG